MMIRLGVELAFQDSKGRFWRRMGVDGRLEELSVNPVDFYGVDRPVPWESG